MTAHEPLGSKKISTLPGSYVDEVYELLIDNREGLALSDLSALEFFERWLEWNGIIGHHRKIVDVLESLGWKYSG